MNPGYNPYTPPTSRWGGGPAPAYGPVARIDGTQLVLRNGAALPPICVKCGRHHASEWRRQKFVWSPPWTIIIALFSLLVGAIIALVLQKRSEFHLPLCAECNARWKHWNLYLGFTAVAVIGLLPVAMLTGTVASSDAVGTVIGFGIFAWLAAVVVVAILRAKRMVVARKITDFETWVRGVHPEAARTLAGYGSVAAPFGTGGGYG